MNAITRISFAQPQQIATTREAGNIAELGAEWAIVARKVLTTSCRFEWQWCGTLGAHDQRLLWYRAQNRGAITTVQDRNGVLYAKLAKYNPESQRRNGLVLTRYVRATRTDGR